MLVQFISTLYSLHKVKRFFHHSFKRYRRNLKKLDDATKESLLLQFAGLRASLAQKDLPVALKAVENLAMTLDHALPRTFWKRCWQSFVGIGIALFIAVLIRTMWFEPYTIPTGSMRPTLKEGDFLVVSKTDFGINVPLRPAHFYFDPDLVKHGSIIVFTAENMNIADSDTTYFYLFNGKKLLVKRLLGKPGDTLYFYGGKIYGIDRQGRDLAHLRDASWAQNLEHIPFIRFDGKAETSKLKNGVFHEATFYQMDQPVAKLSATPMGSVFGEMLPAKTTLTQYSDLWGFKHFAMARLLNEEQLKTLYPKADVGKALLYLELAHHPSLQGGQMIRDEQNRLRPDLNYSTSILPLTDSQVTLISETLTSCRFIVKDGVAYRYGMSLHNQAMQDYLPKLPGVPNGTYEIEKGKAYQVLWGSRTKELPLTHPLYSKDPERVQLLYNLGIEFFNSYSPEKNSRAHPSRYAYFRAGDLYLCGSSIVKKDDPNLVLFLKNEYQKQAISTSIRPYAPFEDAGPPIGSDGKIDADFIRKYGLVIPDKMYLALGDNHAMSGDSRQFGFVPEDNLRGSPSFLFWPTDSRFGSLPQALSSHVTFPNIFVWCAAILFAIISSYRNRQALKTLTQKEKDS